MKLFFISDLHLNEFNLNSYNLFVKFLESLPLETSAVYILGDLFEFWVDDNLSTPFLAKVKQHLRNSALKFPIYIIKGNRDFLLGNKFAKETNTIILPDFYITDLYGKKALLMHGDLLCAKDKLYMFFLKAIRNPISIFIINILPIWFKFKLAKLLRRFSAMLKKSRNNQKNNLRTDNKIISTLSKSPLEYGLCQSSIEKLMLTYDTQLLIHGHTHQPNIHKFMVTDLVNNKANTTSYIRIVLGEWTNEATFLEFNSSGYELKSISL